jgi:hypothetical protein
VLFAVKKYMSFPSVLNNNHSECIPETGTKCMMTEALASQIDNGKRKVVPEIECWNPLRGLNKATKFDSGLHGSAARDTGRLRPAAESLFRRD